MLQFTYLEKKYLLNLVEGCMYGSISLDENWRYLNYKNGDSNLNIDLSLFFSPNDKEIDDLGKYGFIDSCVPNALLNLDMSIQQCTYNFKTNKSDLIANIKRFPEIEDFQRCSVSSEILKESTLWFSIMPKLVTLTAINFNQATGNNVSVFFAGHTEDINGKLDFTVNVVQLPFKLKFKIEGYPDRFVGKSIKERFQEIRDCFSSIYDISKYSAEECVVDKQTKEVLIQFMKRL
ncbi:hypothetical protein [Calothrix sp. PCC 6303]|uniref:hypothetical protein n=1 Tax=Calothrix sp. PCC 6303 TaxID=1170562 RepID=UPI0002A032E2|nr:hypothetical protein [Calothrix sp. PCC 6303]AFZ03217.1 hypothetical protein Cal6303_4310 [Calothrix sp. PCC 6303]